MTDTPALTNEERAVLDKLAEAWNLFITLPAQHPMHQQEFAHAIHAAQRLIMSRPVARVEGWVKNPHPAWVLPTESIKELYIPYTATDEEILPLPKGEV